MTWTVTHRREDGATGTLEIEASGRDAVFAMCRERGIVPLEVRAGRTEGGGRRPGGLLRAACACGAALLVAACAVVAYRLVRPSDSGDGGERVETAARKRRAPREAAPRVARGGATPVREEAKAPEGNPRQRRTVTGRILDIPRNPFGTPIPKDLEYKPIWEYTPEDYARVDPGYAARHERFVEARRRNPWKTPADRELAMLLFAKDGNTGLLIPFDARFREKFLRSLETPIVVEEEDSPELKEQKRQMIEARAYLKREIDEGRDIVAILNEEYKRGRRVAAMRDNLQRELREVQRTATSEREVEDYVAAANAMLEKEGGGRIGLPMAVLRHRLRREARNDDAK